jgi:two-component system C4-dicarboxylate transport response regulator DctD
MYSSKPPRTLRVLVADDDDEMRAFVTATLQANGCSTVEAHDGRELLELLKSTLDSPDLRHGRQDARDLRARRARRIAALEVDLPVVLITVLTDDSLDVVAERLGAVGILRKPFDPDDLLTAVHNATAMRGLHP